MWKIAEEARRLQEQAIMNAKRIEEEQRRRLLEEENELERCRQEYARMTASESKPLESGLGRMPMRSTAGNDSELDGWAAKGEL